MKRNLKKNAKLKASGVLIRLISITWNPSDKVRPSRIYLKSNFILSGIKDLKEWNEKVYQFLEKKFGERPKNIITLGEPATDTVTMGKKYKPLYEL